MCVFKPIFSFFWWKELKAASKSTIGLVDTRTSCMPRADTKPEGDGPGVRSQDGRVSSKRGR